MSKFLGDFTIKILPNGEAIVMLHREDNPLILDTEGIGRKVVRRASNVRFDETLQKWYIMLNTIDGAKRRLERNFQHRSDAIGYEIDFLEEKLQSGDPIEGYFS